MNIAVIVPTIRNESWEIFIKAWEPLFKKHRVLLVKEFGVKRSKQPNTTGYYSVSFWILGFCFDYTKAGSGENF